MNKYTQNEDPQRHQLIPTGDSGRFEADLFEQASENTAAKKTLKDLQNDLQTAMDLELSTIPPYLSALYSIKEGTNRESVEIIRSVVVEEMLHMVMVANLLNAVGGTPVIGKWTPDYPTALPGNVMPKLIVPQKPFSVEAIRIFERIEHPEGGMQFLSTKEKALAKKQGKSYGGIGEFYEAIERTIIRLEDAANKVGKTIFIKDRNQVGNDQYYGAGGKIITVNCKDDAINLIQEIVGQGEGTLGTIFAEKYDPDNDSLIIFGPDVEEYAHYFRFKEIRHERFYSINDSAHRDSHNKGLPTGKRFKVDWDAMYNFMDNPKLANYKKGTAVYEKTKQFNQVYQTLLNNLNDACNGKPDELIKGITIMYDLKYKALELMKTPLRKEDMVNPKDWKEGYTAGPSFELADC